MENRISSPAPFEEKSGETNQTNQIAKLVPGGLLGKWGRATCSALEELDWLDQLKGIGVPSQGQQIQFAASEQRARWVIKTVTNSGNRQIKGRCGR
jgi:hypothetical protein